MEKEEDRGRSWCFEKMRRISDIAFTDYISFVFIPVAALYAIYI